MLFWNGVVVNEDLSSAVFLTRGFSAEELGTSDVEASQRMWTATVGVKGGFDIGDDQWHWDVSYSHARYNTTQTSINLKEEGIRDWIMDGASTVITDANQQYTYFVDTDFYDNQLIDNIVRPGPGIGPRRPDRQQRHEGQRLVRLPDADAGRHAGRPGLPLQAGQVRAALGDRHADHGDHSRRAFAEHRR